MVETTGSPSFDFEEHDELIKTIDEIMQERPELFEKLSKL